MTAFSEELRQRLVSEWEGRAIVRNGYPYRVPPLTPGGATAQLIDLAVALATDLHEETAGAVEEHPLVGRVYESRDPREAGRRVRLASYDAERGKYRAVGAGGHTWTHISESTLKSKWREVSA